jgi:hypothetical protein
MSQRIIDIKSKDIDKLCAYLKRVPSGFCRRMAKELKRSLGTPTNEYGLEMNQVISAWTIDDLVYKAEELGCMDRLKGHINPIAYKLRSDADAATGMTWSDIEDAVQSADEIVRNEKKPRGRKSNG